MNSKKQIASQYRLTCVLLASLAALTFFSQSAQVFAGDTTGKNADDDWFQAYDWRTNWTNLVNDGKANWINGKKPDFDETAEKRTGMFVAVVDSQCIHSPEKLKVFTDTIERQKKSGTQFAIVLRGKPDAKDLALLPQGVPVLNVDEDKVALHPSLTKNFPNLVYMNAYDQVYFRGDSQGVRYVPDKSSVMVKSLPENAIPTGKNHFKLNIPGEADQHFVVNPRGQVFSDAGEALSPDAKKLLDHAFRADQTVLAAVHADKSGKVDAGMKILEGVMVKSDASVIHAKETQLSMDEQLAITKKAAAQPTSLEFKGSALVSELKRMDSADPLGCMTRNLQAAKLGSQQAISGQFILNPYLNATLYQTPAASPAGPSEVACQSDALKSEEELTCCRAGFKATIPDLADERNLAKLGASPHPDDQNCLYSMSQGETDAKDFCAVQNAHLCNQSIRTAHVTHAGCYQIGFHKAKKRACKNRKQDREIASLTDKLRAEAGSNSSLAVNQPTTRQGQ